MSHVKTSKSCFISRDRSRKECLTDTFADCLYCRCLNQIRTLIPVLISAVKVYINLLHQQSTAVTDARNNRDYSCKAICSEIQEIIRVLQLTSADDDEMEVDDAAAIRKCLVRDFYLVPSV